MRGDRLAVYLQDHLAGAVLGTELARRVARENRGSEFGPGLDALASAIDEDRHTLERVLATAGVSRPQVKRAFAWTLEKAGRLKLNGQLRGYSPLSRLLELEGLAAGITAKRSLWVSLGELAATDSRLAGFDFGALVARADAQLAEVERQRRRAVPPALARPAN
jgi:hypothetical protein